jgi:hypothetical protein
MSPRGEFSSPRFENVQRCSHPIEIATTPKAPARRTKNLISADFSRLESMRALLIPKPAHEKNTRVIFAIAETNTNDFGTKRRRGPYRTTDRSARGPDPRTKCKLPTNVGARTTRIFSLCRPAQRALD